MSLQAALKKWDKLAPALEGLHGSHVMKVAVLVKDFDDKLQR